MKNPNIVWEKSTPPSPSVSVEHHGESSKNQEKSSATHSLTQPRENKKALNKLHVFGKRQETSNEAFMEKFNITGLRKHVKDAAAKQPNGAAKPYRTKINSFYAVQHVFKAS